MMFAWKLLTSSLGGPVASVFLVLSLCALLGQCQATGSAKRALGKAEKAAAVATANLGTCRANVSGLKASIDRQNLAVEAMKAEGAARIAQSEKAAKNARAVAESYRQASDRVLRVKPGADVCVSADRMILDAVGVGR